MTRFAGDPLPDSVRIAIAWHADPELRAAVGEERLTIFRRHR